MRRERGVGVAVDADELRRDALADLGLVARLREHHQPAVAVEVDEPGRDDVPRRRRRSRRRLDRLVRAGQRRCRSPATATRPGHPGRAGAVDDGAALEEEVDARVVTRSPAARRARGPRTQASRTMSGCGRNASRDMISAGSSESIPSTGATSRGSTAIMSASLPGSSEPIASSCPAPARRSSVRSRSQSSGSERLRRRARRRARGGRSGCTPRRACSRRSTAPGRRTRRSPSPTRIPAAR